MKNIIFLLTLSHLGLFAQYEQIDKYAQNLDFKQNTTIDEMAQKITVKSINDEEKLRAIFSWITHNISYDTKSFFSGNIPNSTPKNVIHEKIAVCQGYCNLFQAMAQSVGIKSFVVSGFSKGYGFQDRNKLENFDHAWIAANAGKEWYLIDPTWGAGHINQKGIFVRQKKEEYFLGDPLFFIKQHLPEDPVWQMLPCPIQPEEFLKDTAEVVSIAKKKKKCYAYKDTLSAFMLLDSVKQSIAKARRMIDYFPDNKYSPAILYNQAAYYYSLPLNDQSLSIEKKKELAQKSLKYYTKAEEILKGNLKLHEKQLKQMIKQNISNVEQFISFYKNN